MTKCDATGVPSNIFLISQKIKCFLPLELEIAALVRKGVALITMDDMKKINSQQAIRPLTDPELKVFCLLFTALCKT
jgi:hypothetical protein